MSDMLIAVRTCSLPGYADRLAAQKATWIPQAEALGFDVKIFDGGTSYATANLLANRELGVAAQVETCTSSTGSWQTLTFSAITPTKAGWVKIRVTSYDTSASANTLFGALTTT